VTRQTLSPRELAEVFGMLRWPFLPLDERAYGVLKSDDFAQRARALEERYTGWPGVEPGALAAAARALVSAHEHESLFHRSFRGSMVVSPFQTDYTASHAFEQARELADMGGFYRAFGLASSPQGVDRIDHIAAQLEYLCVLAWHEAQGIDSGDEERAHVARSALDEFLREHPGRWFDEFAKRCRQRSVPALFTAAAALAASVVGERLQAMGATPRSPDATMLPMAGVP
jgi:TorA maturation chaperone TorD